MANGEEILHVFKDFYWLLYSSQTEAKFISNAEPGILIHRKSEVNQGSQALPDSTMDEIRFVSKKTENNKSPNKVSVVANVIEIGGSYLLQTVKTLFNFCLSNSTITDKWYNEIIILLHRNKGINELGNYRSISLLSHLYKLFARIIRIQFENKLDSVPKTIFRASKL